MMLEVFIFNPYRSNKAYQYSLFYMNLKRALDFLPEMMCRKLFNFEYVSRLSSYDFHPKHVWLRRIFNNSEGTIIYL
jgi:hypothetical protein